MRRNLGESRFIIIHFRNAASFLYGTGCCLSLAQSATVKIKNIVAPADMRRHSDTLRGAQRRRKRGLRGENRISVSEFCCLPVSICLHVLILSHVLPERVARRENIRASVCAARMLSLRQNKNSSFPGHAPGKDTLRAANAATKERFTGRKQNKRSEFCCLPVIS